MLIHHRFLLSVTLNVSGEPFIELLMGVEHARHDEVEQCPQLEKGVGRKGRSYGEGGEKEAGIGGRGEGRRDREGRRKEG